MPVDFSYGPSKNEERIRSERRRSYIARLMQKYPRLSSFEAKRIADRKRY